MLLAEHRDLRVSHLDILTRSQISLRGFCGPQGQTPQSSHEVAFCSSNKPRAPPYESIRCMVSVSEMLASPRVSGRPVCLSSPDSRLVAPMTFFRHRSVPCCCPCSSNHCLYCCPTLFCVHTHADPSAGSSLSTQIPQGSMWPPQTCCQSRLWTWRPASTTRRW
jgi:hypothetical protein